MKQILAFLCVIFFSAALWAEQDGSPQEEQVPTTESAVSEHEDEGKDSSDEKLSSADELLRNSKLMHEVKNAIFFVRDLLDDKMPVRIDAGAEPQQHGSTIFGAAYYDFTPRMGCSFLAEYSSYAIMNSETSPLANQVMNQSSQAASVLTLPFIMYFGDPDISAKRPMLRFGLGAFYKFTWEKYTQGEFLAEGSILTEGTTARQSVWTEADLTMKYHRIGPAFEYALNVPIFKYLRIDYSGLVIPLYYTPINATTDIRGYYKSGTYTESDGKYEYTWNNIESYTIPSISLFSQSWSSPLIEQSFSIDLFRYLRVAAKVNYESVKFQVVQINDESTDTEEMNYTTHTIDFRVGGEILKPTKNRKKSSHLRAGVYYRMKWDFNVYKDEVSKSREDSILVCFGT